MLSKLTLTLPTTTRDSNDDGKDDHEQEGSGSR
jgi:hypothetical protein